jgi:hypothetical protein
MPSQTFETYKKKQRVLINTGLQPGVAFGKRETVLTVSAADKPLKRLVLRATSHTRLKPGVNEMSQTVTHFGELQ